jgi:hypothetical protein
MKRQIKSSMKLGRLKRRADAETSLNEVVR